MFNSNAPESMIVKELPVNIFIIYIYLSDKPDPFKLRNNQCYKSILITLVNIKIDLTLLD